MTLAKHAYEDCLVEGASDQGLGFFLNTFRRGQRTEVGDAESSNKVCRLSHPAVKISVRLQRLHGNAFVTKTRSSTTADVALVSPVWHGMSFYENDKGILQSHLLCLRGCTQRDLQWKEEDLKRERKISSSYHRILPGDMGFCLSAGKERYDMQRGLFHTQRDRSKLPARLAHSPSHEKETGVSSLFDTVVVVRRKPDSRFADRERRACLTELYAFEKRLSVAKRVPENTSLFCSI